MAIIARFSFDVPFGRKPQLFEMMKKYEPLRKEIGFPESEVLVGSIGAPESRVEINYRYDSISALEATWVKIGSDPKTQEMQREMASFIVPGTHRWDIFRVQQ